MTHSELAKLIIKTFENIATFCSDEYTTDELIDRAPEAALESLQLRFEVLMATFEGIEFFVIEDEQDMHNWFTIAGYKSNGIEAAITEYHNG